jgi:hypothetical protein
VSQRVKPHRRFDPELSAQEAQAAQAHARTRVAEACQLEAEARRVEAEARRQAATTEVERQKAARLNAHAERLSAEARTRRIKQHSKMVEAQLRAEQERLCLQAETERLREARKQQQLRETLDPAGERKRIEAAHTLQRRWKVAIRVLVVVLTVYFAWSFLPHLRGLITLALLGVGFVAYLCYLTRTGS